MVIFACPMREAICNDGRVVIGYEGYPCRAWVQTTYWCTKSNDCPDCDCGDCMSGCARMVKEVSTEGYCRLIPKEI